MSRLEGSGYVTVVPWYDRVGFAEICSASANGGPNYDRWRRQATRAVETLLRAGRAIEIVAVHPADYRAWLVLHAHLDNQASRQRFVRELATGHHQSGLRECLRSGPVPIPST
jgi:Fe-S oxidoreductase